MPTFACRCQKSVSIEVHVKSWATGNNSRNCFLMWGLSLEGRCPYFLRDRTDKQYILGGHLNSIVFCPLVGAGGVRGGGGGGGVQAFVLLMKHLIDFGGNKLSHFSRRVCFFIP